MKINNKDVIQSYILTTARYDFDVYEKRILYRLVELCQPQLEKQSLDSRFSINPDLWGMCEIKIPTKYLLNGEEDKNHARIKNALTSLRNKTFEYEDDKIWKLIGIVETPILNKNSEYVEFKIHPEIYAAILGFAKGFRKIELKTAMSFESIYTMRFYELFSGQKKPITYTIANLKLMFKLVDKYNQVNDFIKRIIEPAKKELTLKSPYSFEYKANKEGKKFVSITFYPVYNPANRDGDLETTALKKQISPSWSIDKMIVDYLKQNYVFDSKEINNNIDLLKAADQQMDLILFLSQMRRKCEGKANPKGYLINAIRKQLNVEK